MTNIINSVPYLRTSRNFPEDVSELTTELSKTYIDIANNVNLRTIGIFPTNFSSITGESWFLSKNQRQQSFRQVYNFGPGYVNFDHNIMFSNVSTFTVIRGIGFDGANYFPLPFVNGTIIAGQVEMFVSPTQVIFIAGGSAPVLVRGIVLLEWLSNP